MKQILAYHNDKKLKDKHVKKMIQHRKADEIVKGKYWENGKGCAVGCTLEMDNSDGLIHKHEEEILGIPEELSRLKDWLFESLENGKAKLFPEQFLEVINVGADLTDVCRKFKLKIQRENLSLQIRQSKKFPELKDVYDKVIPAIKKVIDCIEQKHPAESAAR